MSTHNIGRLMRNYPNKIPSKNIYLIFQSILPQRKFQFWPAHPFFWRGLSK
jgi:hypothetical protein